MPSKPDKFSTLQQVYLLSDILYQHGVDTAIICPGSRNAPLIEGFNSNKKIECISIVDERSAAYFALGVAQQSCNPVAIITTSGTATLNLAPAIAEAYYQGIPLIIITADRPQEWIDQEDNQAIRQRDIYRNYIKYSCELPTKITNETDQWHCERLINESVIIAKAGRPGPVHINVPFREPLYEKTDQKPATGKKIVEPGIKNILSNSEVRKAIKNWNTYTKRLILVGAMNQNSKLEEELIRLAESDEAVVIAEKTSNIHGNKIIKGFDNFNLNESSENLQPELLITIGNNFISKNLKNFIRKIKPESHWHLTRSEHVTDTFQSLTHIYKVEPEYYLNILFDGSIKRTNSSFTKEWLELFAKVKTSQNLFVSNAEYSDLTCVKYIIESIPEGSIVQLGNSMPVRYYEMIYNSKKLLSFSNRGTSGVDGCVSTAVGAAWNKKDKFTTLIVGDISFFYDSNALWNKYINPKFRIIILNNGSGNIFDMIDGPSDFPENKSFFTTPHHRSAEKLAEDFDVDYLDANNSESIINALNNFYKETGKARILEVFTNSETNAKVFKQYIDYIKSNTNDTTRLENN